MEKIFNFNQVGKRMPYNVPDGFFDQLEADVMQEVAKPQSREMATPHSDSKAKKARFIKITVRSMLSAAAALALFFVVRTTLPKSEPVLASADDYASVELAFAQLSTDDQDFLIAVYENEEFINVLTNDLIE